MYNLLVHLQKNRDFLSKNANQSSRTNGRKDVSKIDIEVPDMILFDVLISNRYIDIDSISKHK